MPYKTALPEANMEYKMTYPKERSIAGNYFICLNFFFILRTSYKELI